MEKIRINKVATRTTKNKPPRNRSVYDEVGELNGWNPFQRVNPCVLEAIHKRHQQNKITHILETTEVSLW